MEKKRSRRDCFIDRGMRAITNERVLLHKKIYSDGKRGVNGCRCLECKIQTKHPFQQTHLNVFLSKIPRTPLSITSETLEAAESRFLHILFCFHSSSSNSQASTNTAVYTQQSIKGTYEAGSKNGIFTPALESATGCFFFLGFYT